MKYHEQGYRVVLDADIVGFFDNLPRRSSRKQSRLRSPTATSWTWSRNSFARA